jgi:hypothetical protein
MLIAGQQHPRDWVMLEYSYTSLLAKKRYIGFGVIQANHKKYFTKE